MRVQAAMLKPDPSKFGPGPYPTVVPVYGGPHVQTVSNSWTLTADLRSQFLCSQGFLILKIDNRGSSRCGLGVVVTRAERGAVLKPRGLSGEGMWQEGAGVRGADQVGYGEFGGTGPEGRS